MVLGAAADVTPLRMKNIVTAVMSTKEATKMGRAFDEWVVPIDIPPSSALG